MITILECLSQQKFWFNGTLILCTDEILPWIPILAITYEGRLFYFSHYEEFADDIIYIYTTDEADIEVQWAEEGGESSAAE